ncbi:ABC_transporter family protein [Hexamita inflata]|uniref:ABC transporter family protein n=1 Tax=Hexamita inflata TaxID=28002 RepID=A0AA86NM27_9EUKA|nr:ABC transporter family protein [Hexamita inflata]
MNPLLSYYLYQAKSQWLTILLLLVVPVVIPFVIYAIMISFMNTIDDVKVKPFEAPLLPSLDRVAYADKNLVYFSYSPDKPEFKAFVENIFALNGIKNARTRAFASPEEAEHYFNVKNIGRLAKERYENSSFYSSIICEDYRAYIGDKHAECSIDLSGNYKDIMRRYYNLSEDDLTPNMSLYEDNVLFHINFFESAELIQGVPKNITYEIVYNTTILDKTIVDYPDSLSKQFGNNPLTPFWTGYSYTLQENLNKLVLKKHTNIDLQTSNKRVDKLINSFISAEMFFEITIAFSWSVLFILATLLSINNKGKNQVIIRRLGVKELNFYLANYMFTLIPTLLSCLLMQIVWYSTALLPFSAITFGFGMLVHVVVAFLVTACSIFISCLMGQSHSGAIVVSCLLSYFLLMLPSMFHAGMFQGSTLWDPTLVPQWGTWFSMTLLPPFSLMGLIDSMTSSLDPLTRSVVLTQYDWKIQEKVTPIKYLFTDYQKYHSMTRFCMNSNSKHGEISPIYNRCIYHQPLYGNVVLLASLQALVLLPLLSLWYSYTVSEKGFRGLPSFFVFTRRFWKKRSALKPGKPVIAVKNLSVGFKTKGKACKKNTDVRARALGKKKLALAQLDYFQEAGTISALVAESSSGKSTTMSFLAGEVNQLDLKKFAAKRARRLGLKLEDLDSQNVYDRYFEAQDECQALSALRLVDDTTATILENYDLTDPIDAYFVKPFVGHLPQDFSNVWMNMSCFHNVYFSLLLRTSSQRRSVSKKEAVQQTKDTLKMMELDDPDVQKRTAARLSGGMLRRLALCNVVVGDPKILLLDEISAGVDPVVKRKIWKCVQDLKNRVDVSVILSTHDTSEIAEMAQRITIMDKGFTLVRNQSPFDLRQNFHTYSVKFYNEAPTCSNQLAEDIVQEIGREMGFEGSVMIDSVSPHGIQILVQQQLSGPQVLKLSQFLSQLTTLHKFQDYILQKAKLDDVYIDTIKYKRIAASITDQQQDLQQTILTKQNQLMNRIAALFQKSILSEFKHRFPHIIMFSLVCVLISLIIHYFVLLMKLVIDISTKANIIQNRQKDNAFGCFGGCSTSSPQGIAQCIINRPEKLFTFNDNYYSQNNRCGWYMHYLGLDSTQHSYIAMGDYRYNNRQAHNYHFSINEHEIATKQKSMQSQLLFDKNNIVTQQNSSINFQVYPQFKKYFSNFDPSVNKTEGGVLPYILPKFFAQYTTSNTCEEYWLCRQTCYDFQYQAEACYDQFDMNKCISSCKYDSCYSGWNIFMRNSTRTFKNDQEALNVYKETMTGKLEYRNESYWNSNNLIKFGEDFGLKQNIVNFKFNKYEASLQKGKLSGTIQLELQHPVPNRGLTGDGYMLNKQCAKFLDYPEFVCDEGIKNKYYSDSECYVLPSMPRPHGQSWSDTVFLQSLPDRDHVTLFDIQNEPLTALTSAFIRKQIFQNSPVNDQKPWQFAYSLVARTMSFMGNPNMVQSTQASENDMIMSFMIMQIVAAGMIPMMYSGLKLGGEIESNIIRLLQFHFTSPTSWIINSLVYYIVITAIIIIINLLGEWIFLPELVSNPTNIILYIVESVESIITGMLLAVLTQKARTAVIYSFFIILFVMLFSFMSFGSTTFTYLLGLFLPAYTMSYEFLMATQHLLLNIPIFVYGVSISVLQIVIIVVMVNWDAVKMIVRKKLCKSKHYGNIMVNGVEQYEAETPDVENTGSSMLVVQNVHHIYDTGTYALKGINLDIPKGQIFGLLGSNGSGKSTLMHCMAGIYKPTGGKALMDTPDGVVDLFKFQQVSKYFSIVPQHDIYWPNLSVIDHLQLMQKLNSLQRPVRLDLLMSALQLDEVKDQPADSLSGGVKRRLSIAMAMTTAPQVLAFDEPSCGLGVTTKRFVHQAILRVLNNETTLMLTTHDMEEVEALVDQCCIMNLGKVLKVGSVGQLRQACEVQFELTLRESEETVRKVADEMKTKSVRRNEMCDVWIVEVLRGTSQQHVLETLDKHSLLDSSWSMEAVRMEHVFMELVEQHVLNMESDTLE